MVQRLVNLILERGLVQLSRKRYYLLVRCLCAMLCCITFLLTSNTTNAQSLPNYVSKSKNFSRSFNITIYPDSSTTTGFNVGFTESGGTATYKIKLDNDPATHATGTYNSSTGYINISPGYYDIDGTATPNSSTTSGTITGTIGSAGGYSYFDTDLTFNILPYLFTVEEYNSVYPYIGFTASDLSVTSNIGSLTSSYLTFTSGEPVSVLNYYLKNNINHRGSDNNWYMVPDLMLHTHFSYCLNSLSSNAITFTVTVNFGMYGREFTKEQVSNNNSSFVVDTQGNSLQEQNNQITQDTNTTTHDTNNKITSFFNSFFDNLIHIFVPEEGFFSQWFNSLNDFMAQKLGFLWSPFDFLISFLNGVYSGGGSAGLVFPELAWIDGTVIIPRTEFSFDNIGGESFQDLRDMIYFSTDVILLGAVVSQFYKKIKLVFEGGGD